MNEARYHRLAMRGTAALREALASEPPQGTTLGAARFLPPPAPTPARARPAAPSRPRRFRVKGFSAQLVAPVVSPASGTATPKVLSAWLQYVGTAGYQADVVTADYHQHVHCQPNEVMLLPFETAAYLLASMPGQWQPQTVVPEGVAVVNDPATGTDKVWATGVQCWGVNADGHPYFDIDDGAANNEEVLLVISGGLPTVIR